MMPTCHFLLISLSLFFHLVHCSISFKSIESCYFVVFVDLSSSSLSSLNVQFTVSSSQPILFNYLNLRTSFKLTILLYSVKLSSFSFHESNAPYNFLPPKLNFCPVVSRKCLLIFHLFLCGDIQPNPGSMSVSSRNFASPLDVYEPFSSPALPKLHIATLNARSVCNKSAVISDNILSNKLDIICLTETWINGGEFSNSFASSLLPPNYSLSQYYGRPRPMRGGGSAIINRKSIHHTSISMPVYSTFECIGSSVSLLSFSVKIFTIYRPPSSSFSAFCVEFELLLEHHITSNVDLIFVGNFNIHIDKQDDPNTVVFNRLLLNFNLNQHISSPTHDSGHILDLITTNTSFKLAIYPNLIDTCISNHKTVYIDLNIQIPVAQKLSFTFRPLNKINFTDFYNDITATFSNFEHLDLNSLVSHFNSTLSSLLDKHAPEKSVHITTRSSNPWFTPNLLHERQKRR